MSLRLLASAILAASPAACSFGSPGGGGGGHGGTGGNGGAGAAGGAAFGLNGITRLVGGAWTPPERPAFASAFTEFDPFIAPDGR